MNGYFCWTAIALIVSGKRYNRRNSKLQAQVYARFSPLIGGPSIIPLHIEIMVYHEEQNYTENKIQKLRVLHRIDFLPEHPTNFNTTLALCSLKDVKGEIRHRIYVDQKVQHEADIMDGNRSFSRMFLVDQSRINNLINEGTIYLFSTKDTQDENFRKLPPSFYDLFLEKEKQPLNLLKYNCYSFAYDIYSFMEPFR